MSGDPVLRELRKISKILILTNGPAVEKELSKLATTEERKKIWVLMDGTRMPKDLAKEAGVTSMAVSNFLNSGVATGLVDYARGDPPRRGLDYIPPSWTEFVKQPPSVEESTGQARLVTTSTDEQKETKRKTGA